MKEKMCQIKDCNKCKHKEGDGFKCRYDDIQETTDKVGYKNGAL